MSKKPNGAPAQMPAPVPAPAAPEDIVEVNVRELVSAHPDAISFDVADPANEMLALRCACDPGVASQVKDGLRATVKAWYVGTWTVTEQDSGRLLTLPSLVLITEREDLIRLTGWPCISSWATLLRAAGADRIRAGLPVVIRRRQSGTAGRSYWVILPGGDCPSAPGSGH